MQEPSDVSERIMKIDPLIMEAMQIGKLTNKVTSNKLEMLKEFQEGSKPEVLVDEATIAYLQNPNSLFNLTLSKFPKS